MEEYIEKKSKKKRRQMLILLPRITIMGGNSCELTRLKQLYNEKQSSYFTIEFQKKLCSWGKKSERNEK